MHILDERIGKIALLLAMSDQNEEISIKEQFEKNKTDVTVAVTIVTGLTSDVKASFVKSIVGCALQNRIIKKSGTQIHALLHAALDALNGIVSQVPAEGSLKLKVGIVTDGRWVAVGIYGDSAFYPITNHERSALGVMHLK